MRGGFALSPKSRWPEAHSREHDCQQQAAVLVGNLHGPSFLVCRVHKSDSPRNESHRVHVGAPQGRQLCAVVIVDKALSRSEMEVEARHWL